MLMGMDVASGAGSPDSDFPASESDSAVKTDPAGAARLFEQSAGIMARLRAPGGCPWDREQTFDTIRKYTLEEAYEVFDAIERRDFPHLAEELGDLLLQVLFYAEMAANEGHFTISDVLDHLNRKLMRRHPHVFGEEASRAAGNRGRCGCGCGRDRRARCCGIGKRSRRWRSDRMQRTSAEALGSRLDGVQRAMPALAEAAKLGGKAAEGGVRLAAAGAICCRRWPRKWPSWRPRRQRGGSARSIEAELGDLLFTVVNLARHLGVDAEMALRGCNLRFRRAVQGDGAGGGEAAGRVVAGGAGSACGRQAKNKAQKTG